MTTREPQSHDYADTTAIGKSITWEKVGETGIKGRAQSTRPILVDDVLVIKPHKNSFRFRVTKVRSPYDPGDMHWFEAKLLPEAVLDKS